MNEIQNYIEQTKKRFHSIMEFILFLPASTPHFFPKETVDRMPDAERQEFSRLLKQAKALRMEISQCEENITTRQSEAIQRAGDVEIAGIQAPPDAPPLYLMIHGLFDETIRLSALAMQSISLSRDIARLLEKASTAEDAAKGYAKIAEQMAKFQEMTMANFTAAAEDRAEKAAASAERDKTLQETIEDRNRSRRERWATVPDCVRAALDAVELENKDGKAIEPFHGSRDTLRIRIQEELKRLTGQREKTISKAKNATKFYPIADIAEVMSILYPVWTAAQYIKEFEPFSCDEKNLHRAPCPKR